MFTSNISRGLNIFVTYLTYVFFALFPFLVYSDSFLYFGTSTRSINLITLSSVVAILFGINLLFNKEASISVPRSSIYISIGVYFSFMLISALNSGDFFTAFFSNLTRTTGIWYFVCLGILLSILINICFDEKKRRNLIYTIVISSCLFSVLSALGPEGFGLFFKSLKNDGFTFGNSTFAGMYLFGAFTLSFFLILTSSSRKMWYIAPPILIMCNPYIINIGSNKSSGILSVLGEARASGIAFFGAIVAILIVWAISRIKNTNYKKKISYGIFCFGILGILGMAWSLFSSDGLLRKFYLSQATEARLLVWEISDRLIKERPVLGWGNDNFEKVFELNYDNRLLEARYGNEAWFDRAHNVFIDQAFDNGLLGLCAYLAIYFFIFLSMLFVVFKSQKKHNVILAILILIYFVFHILELQTAFDTSVSYPLIVFIVALSIVIYIETLKENNKPFDYKIGTLSKYIIAVILVIFGGWSIFFGALPFIQSQMANGNIRTVGSSEKRLALYDDLFNTPVDLQAVIWRTLADFEKGIREHPEILDNPKKVENLKKELALFENRYKKYIDSHPRNFRALLNYADIKIYYKLFNVDKLEEAQVVLDKAITLVPQAPQPYQMKAVAYLYMQKFDKAREYAQKALDLNPNVVGSQELYKYIENSIKTFPEIDLYFFKQI